jgi:hypothetical protein
MSDESPNPEPPQRAPKGAEIPVPTRDESERNLGKLGKAVPKEAQEAARQELEYPADETDEG